tara:strand:+ start:50 stop:1351 length:1302 start_codon:yes stop_codon:yes gene_type:complete
MAEATTTNSVTTENPSTPADAQIAEVDQEKMHSPVMKTLQYPYEGLGVEKGLKSYIMFQPVEEKIFSVGAFGDVITNIAKKMTNAVFNPEDLEKVMAAVNKGKKDGKAINAESIDAAGDLFLGMIPQILSSVKTLGTDAIEMLQKMHKAFEEGKAGNKGKQLFVTDASYIEPNTRGDIQIKLYMSPAQTFSDAVEIGKASLGGMDQTRLAKMDGSDAGISDTLLRGAATLGTLASGNGSDVNKMLGGIALQNAGKMPVVGGAISKTGIPQVASIGTRTVATNHYRFIFKGVEFRTFSFAFDMKAESIREAKEIKEIIKRFRQELYPIKLSAEIGKDAKAKIEMGYKYPDRFLISMMHEGVPVLHRIKPCYLESMKTTYNGSDDGMNAFRKGYTEFDEKGKGIGEKTFEPISVSFELSFKESLKLNQQDIKDGY